MTTNDPSPRAIHVKANPRPHAPDIAPLHDRAQRLGLFGVLGCWAQIAHEPWLPTLVDLEERARMSRSLERRIKTARIGKYKPMADFDWAWPTKIDREAIEELLTLRFIDEGANGVLVGPNGLGKTMILRNAAHEAALQGHTVRFTTASDMLADLAAQDSSAALSRRLRHYTQPRLLCVDEVGYLSYSARYADLLFEVVTRRYDQPRSILLSTNKHFKEWSDVFPHAACVVTLIDRLIHRAEIVDIEGESYRLKEAKELAAKKAAARKGKKRAT